jgi:phenylacetic acid degradation operon negative regulatory protein
MMGKQQGSSRATLRPILRHVSEEPSRTWSIIITVYGDALLPRGGLAGLSILLEILRAMGIANGVVRTAMSRLASDGWVERKRVGRNSFYQIAEKGRKTFQQAAQHIYNPRSPAWNGSFQAILVDDRDKDADSLRQIGFGPLSNEIWIAPGSRPLPIFGNAGINFRVSGDDAANRALAARTWHLNDTADAYRRFTKAFDPLRGALAASMTISDLEAVVARVLLIHEYRRVVLRDPLLPAEILPPAWPGETARALCAEVYTALLPPSERWLDKHVFDEFGSPMPASAEISRRFDKTI